MKQPPINKSMDRDDLLTVEGQEFVAKLSRLADTMENRELPVTSWYGALPKRGFKLAIANARRLTRRLLPAPSAGLSGEYINRGGESYEPVPGIAADERHPWFLYWEAYWVAARGPSLKSGDRVLDAGGTASLFSCYLASTGAEIHSVDLNRNLVAAGSQLAKGMGWNMTSHCMDMTRLEFPDEYFDHAFSICVFEHLRSESRQAALSEIARVLKPGGILSLTFDYRGPGVYLCDSGVNFEPENLIRSPEDVKRHFLVADGFEPVGNAEFVDNNKSYLRWPRGDHQPYTFGAAFLRKAAQVLD